MRASSSIKRMLSFFLSVALVVGIAPAYAFAYEGEEGLSASGATTAELPADVEAAVDEEGSETADTFMDDAEEFVEVVTIGSEGESVPDSVGDIMMDGVSSVDSVVEQVSYDQAIEILRRAMANRETSVSFSLETDSSYKQLASEMFYASMNEDGDPQHGDYLRYIWDNMSCQMRYRVSGQQTYLVTYTYSISYKTTMAQEQALMAKVDEVLGGMQLGAKSDYEKTKAIYDYICTHATYDYERLNDSSYKLKYSAYAALIDGRAVCQGYASLFYLMAGEAGLDARIVSGIGDGKGHSWNIVKLGGAWYNLDATWDAERAQAGRGYAYFLKSDADFGDHARGKHGNKEAYAIDYGSDAFYASHPMASKSYGAEVGAWKKDSTGWWYERANGTWPAFCWEQINGKWYHFDKSGYMQTGWLYQDGIWYYLDNSGAMQTGWVYWNNDWYYMNGSGIMDTGWLYTNGVWRYLGGDGAMDTGWLWWGSEWYYLDPANDGIMATGWVYWNNDWYYMNGSGAMATGWISWCGDWYYLYSSGKMAHDCWYGDYYLLSDGSMATNQWVGRWYVGGDGEWITWKTMSPRTLKIKGTTVSYISSCGYTPATGAGVWQGEDSTTDNDFSYIIGHNPGSFECVTRLGYGDVVTMCDKAGNARDYRVVNIFYVSNGTYWNEVEGRVTSRGESITFQTCVNGGSHYRLVVCDAV